MPDISRDVSHHKSKIGGAGLAGGTKTGPAPAADTGFMAADPRELVQAYYAAVDAGDLERLLAMFHPAVEYHRGGYPPIRGAHELRHFYQEVRVIASGRHRVDAVLVDGDRAAVRGSFAGTGRDGRELAVQWADFFTLVDGLIHRRYTYFLAPGV